MTFAWPHLLWLLTLPAALFGWELTRRRRAAAETKHPKILRAEVSTRELQVVRDPARAIGQRARPWLALGLAFGIVALARPQWGRSEEPVFDQSREILLAIDLSRSMLSPDVRPSRLDRAKLLIQALLERLEGERVGLVVFSGTAFLQSPLSADYEILRDFLPALGPDFLPEGGTNYEALITTSLDAFGGSAAADRFLIILSDGEATDDRWRSSVDELKKKGIRVIGLGVGTTAGTMIPDGSGGFVKDQRGAVVMSRLESGTLKELAGATNGAYRDASNWIDLPALVEATVNTGRKGDFADKNTVKLVERFQWPLALAVWFILVSLTYEFPVQPRPRAIALRSSPAAKPGSAGAASSGAAALLLLLALVCAGNPRLEAAIKAAPPSTGPTTPAEAGRPGDSAALTKIVGRLSQKDALSASDLSEFAHETLNWGRRLAESGTRVPEGPVRDALAAVDQLQAKGDRLADWSRLRTDLQDLLQEPEKQPQQKQQQQNQDKPQDQQKQQGDKDQKQSGESKDKQQQDGEKSESQPQQSEQQSQPQGAQEKKQDQPFAFGDMSQTPPPPPTETQKVGGAPEKKPGTPPPDPALAVPLQKLDELRNQDSPAQLFQSMQPERSQGTQKKPAKDW